MAGNGNAQPPFVIVFIGLHFITTISALSNFLAILWPRTLLCMISSRDPRHEPALRHGNQKNIQA
ncbi:predicted protein [Pyrenophora tritici-repentis Pt-1C-BFP]|uniref:Uncharacterized protein n=1 Tax=Pyrenophora tritici-repentis (strain Pt-1C-BFP) TaxID=426418 RepID=B2VW23_PYRTR|nr:uncharacterized protein PTRG_01385 [Pyrenophora tritici-repentis Pt-1C-BFP]EDU40823.1 predicted protein [Pyrenophora tritici-repentis Pt-1C-BFP]